MQFSCVVLSQQKAASWQAKDQPQSELSKSQSKLDPSPSVVAVVVVVASCLTLTESELDRSEREREQGFRTYRQPGVRLRSSRAMSPCWPSATVASMTNL